MRIGLISDTHIPFAAKRLPPQIWEVFRGVDLIMHAGDVYDLAVLNELESIAPVIAALGDDDENEVAQDHRVKERHTIVLDGVTFWLTHARPPYWIHGADTTPGGNIELPDVIVCGHSHFVAVLNSQGVLVVNPGSPTFPRYQRELGTVGLLTIDQGEVVTQIVELASWDSDR